MSTAPSTHSYRGRRRRGATAVELALILPVLIPIVLGCVDLGRFAYTWIAVTNAARAGAGFASSHPFTTATKPIWEQGTRDTAISEMVDPDDPDPRFEINDIAVSTEVLPEDDGQGRARVTVKYPFEPLVNWPWEQWSSGIDLSRTVEMRVLFD